MPNFVVTSVICFYFCVLIAIHCWLHVAGLHDITKASACSAYWVSLLVPKPIGIDMIRGKLKGTKKISMEKK